MREKTPPIAHTMEPTMDTKLITCEGEGREEGKEGDSKMKKR